jgi:Sec-independent protein translocase protein TatA
MENLIRNAGRGGRRCKKTFEDETEENELERRETNNQAYSSELSKPK